MVYSVFFESDLIGENLGLTANCKNRIHFHFRNSITSVEQYFAIQRVIYEICHSSQREIKRCGDQIKLSRQSLGRIYPTPASWELKPFVSLMTERLP